MMTIGNWKRKHGAASGAMSGRARSVGLGEAPLHVSTRRVEGRGGEPRTPYTRARTDPKEVPDGGSRRHVLVGRGRHRRGRRARHRHLLPADDRARAGRRRCRRAPRPVGAAARSASPHSSAAARRSPGTGAASRRPADERRGRATATSTSTSASACTCAEWAADRTARVHYRGTAWTARLRRERQPAGGEHVVTAVEGNWLVLAPASAS